MASAEDPRISRLLKLFTEVVYGRRILNSSRDGKLFIEAVCAQADPPSCLHRLLSNPPGLDALQQSVRFDTSSSFINKTSVLLLQYLRHPPLETIDSGLALEKVLLSIVNPPFFWDALTKAFGGHNLTPDASQTYAWLLLRLVLLPGKASVPYQAIAKSQGILEAILKSSEGETRILGQKIKHALSLSSSDLHVDAEARPGGRHDNDHANHRDISIMPTSDELLSQERPFLRAADFIENPELTSSRDALHLDNQFRLLREDMLGEIREEIQTFTGSKPGRHKGLILENLIITGVETGVSRRRQAWGIKFQCPKELPALARIEPKKRKTYLLDNRHILRNGNMACLLVHNEPVAFPTIKRNEDDLAQTPASLVVQFPNDSTLSYALLKIKTATDIKLVQLDSATFAFEPFLKRLQEMKGLPLSSEILHWDNGKILSGPSFEPTQTIEHLQAIAGENLQSLLETKKPIKLDDSQMRSLCASLSQRVSLVQGPPGTGKSLTGAVVAKVLFNSTSQSILVICFTNHALDQFLEDLMDIGIPSSNMIRLGGKSTDRTKPLTLREQTAGKITPTQWDQINKLETKLQKHEKHLQEAFQRYRAVNTTKQHLMEYLEFASEDLPFYEAFLVPGENTGGMTHIGRRGKVVGPFYLLDRWIRGLTEAGAFQHVLPKGAIAVWRMTPEMRQSSLNKWQSAIMEDLVAEIRRIGEDFNTDQVEIERIFSQKDANVIKEKRIIACTTNGAAKYAQAIQAASPGVVLVEEAGEILESHILTAMGPSTEQLILIGDHQQLRPKCSYELSVDGGNGYDLNRSLFERLVLKGFPHVTLTIQHRMRPEISALIRHLTYPDLIDAPLTLKRPDLRGFQDNLMFIGHSEPEIELKQFRELRDQGATSSKQNLFEAKMILKCVRYLAQQGYSSDKLVVLTPYLGQLKKLREQLSEENDPILNDLDKFDLIRAGLLTDVSSKTTKPSLRISTIDNYQGEESEIVLVSLTRSNSSHDIGFMSAPERLNVLLSRARNALIIVGNVDTFLHARKGRAVWRKLLDNLKENGHIYEGFPVKCEKHPNRTAILSSPEAFDAHVPDGGCKDPCGVLLNCGVHKCPSSCHQLYDHSKMKCVAIMTQNCSNGHPHTFRCHSGSSVGACQKCERERKEASKKAQKALEDQQRRDAQIQKHLLEVAKIQDEIDKVTQNTKDARLQSEQENILAQKRKDLAAAKDAADKAKSAPLNADPSGRATTTPPQLVPRSGQNTGPQPGRPPMPSKDNKSQPNNLKIDHKPSPSQEEWQRQKDLQNESNPAIDLIMEMIGLEDVKSQVLRIKSKVETSVRQGTDLKKERLGLVLLGNPGTGKTTVARHYAKILTSLQVLSGDGFVETTGSRLAHGGVNEVKDHLKTLEKCEGGVYFIDEAYQLAEGHNFGGKTVLDFLLAEIENLTGRVVFIFAGYRKQMEKFFEHNPGFASRIPYTLHFEDYTDAELLKMLQYQIDKFYQSTIDVDDGKDGLYMRIAVRRLGRGRGRDGFGNARALENLFSRIRGRQSDRLARERREGLSPDDYAFTREDLIGPDPSEAILRCPSWNKLQGLTGLKSVKDSVSYLIDLIKTNYERELQEKELIEVSLNRVFLGSPGTGKTTVAKLYGRILADIGLLSNGEVVTKNPADFIGSAMGQSEANTKAILATTVGKVLIIDEAYMLYSGSGAGDMYKTAVIDTIVAEVQSVPGEDRCVLLLGYEDQMVEMFQNVNPGLTRRFQLSDAFRFEDFNDSELQEILELKLRDQGLEATDRAKSVAIDVLGRLRNGLNFGNGGDVENIISKAKGSFQTRQSRLPSSKRSIDFVFEPQDFDADFDRAAGAEMNLQALFQDVIGCEGIVAKLDGYLKVAKGMRAQGLDPKGQIPMNFIFKGPPGTGKTTTARKFGQVYYDLGFLSHIEVVECSATDLIGSYVGQTGPKTIKQLERGLGKVLFVDEAYRLSGGLFAQEAVNELVDTMTKPKFAGKMVIILAGYDNDMNNLLRVNEGLSSRFADEVIFQALSPDGSLQLLKSRLKQSNIVIPTLEDSTAYEEFIAPIRELSRLPSWGNARDIQTLAKSMVRTAYQTNTSKVDQLILPQSEALNCIQLMLADRQARNSLASRPSAQLQEIPQLMDSSTQEAPIFKPSSESRTAPEVKDEPDLPQPAKKQGAEDTGRDAGVSDMVWAQLQKDKEAEVLRARDIEQKLRDQQEACRLAEEAEKRHVAEAKKLREIQAKNEAEGLQLLRQREEARVREMEAKAKRESAQREMERMRRQEMERKRLNQEVQAKLRDMGVCPVGFRWIKQAGGYICSGGTHFVTDGQLGR